MIVVCKCSPFPMSIADNLYDVFVNVRDDEAEHCKTMKACQTHGKLRSPHSTNNNLETDT
jgi:ubiquinol oxidase